MSLLWPDIQMDFHAFGPVGSLHTFTAHAQLFSERGTLLIKWRKIKIHHIFYLWKIVWHFPHLLRHCQLPFLLEKCCKASMYFLNRKIVARQRCLVSKWIELGWSRMGALSYYRFNSSLSVMVNHTGLAPLLYDFELHGTWGPCNSIPSLSKWNGRCRNQICSWGTNVPFFRCRSLSLISRKRPVMIWIRTKPKTATATPEEAF